MYTKSVILKDKPAVDDWEDLRLSDILIGDSEIIQKNSDSTENIRYPHWGFWNCTKTSHHMENYKKTYFVSY